MEMMIFDAFDSDSGLSGPRDFIGFTCLETSGDDDTLFLIYRITNYNIWSYKMEMLLSFFFFLREKR